MFRVFDTVKIVYICVFMTCLCDTLSDLWNVCIYVLCIIYFGLCTFFRVV